MLNKGTEVIHKGNIKGFVCDSDPESNLTHIIFEDDNKVYVYDDEYIERYIQVTKQGNSYPKYVPKYKRI